MTRFAAWRAKRRRERRVRSRALFAGSVQSDAGELDGGAQGVLAGLLYGSFGIVRVIGQERVNGVLQGGNVILGRSLGG